MPDDLKKSGFDPKTLEDMISGKLKEVHEKEDKKGGVEKLVDFLDATLEWEEFDEEKCGGNEEKP